MARGANQKLKIIYLCKLFFEKTDESHAITMNDMISYLASYGITAERKSIYDDIESLRHFGLDIIGEQKARTYYYQLASRNFELAELKLLVDAVQSSKFITAKKSTELIHKIEGLTSEYEAHELQRQVFVAERIKTMNESIYYSVDKLHMAINTNCQISFQYFQWNVNKEMEKKYHGKTYIVSPWAMSWTDENYYLIAYDREVQYIKHYRVDKMLHLEITDLPREGKEHFEKFDMAVYAKKMFGMFGGNEQFVKLRFRNDMAGIVIDRFGKNVAFRKADEEHFDIRVEVAVSEPFLGWIFGLGDGVQVIGPPELKERMKEELNRRLAMYTI